MDIKRGRKLMTEIMSSQPIDSCLDFRFWKFVYFCLLSVFMRHDRDSRAHFFLGSWIAVNILLVPEAETIPLAFCSHEFDAASCLLSFLPRVLLFLQAYCTHFWLVLTVGLSFLQKEKSKTVVSQIHTVQHHMFCI